MCSQYVLLMQVYVDFFKVSEVMDEVLEKNENDCCVVQLKQIEESEGCLLVYYYLCFVGDGKQLVMVFQSDVLDVVVLCGQLVDYQVLVMEIQNSGVGKDDLMWGYVQCLVDKLVCIIGCGVECLEQGKLIIVDVLVVECKVLGSWFIIDFEGVQLMILDVYNDLVIISNCMC